MIGGIIAVLTTTTALAHVKWFIDPHLPTPAGFEPYTLHDPAVQVWIGIAVFLIVASIILDRLLPTIPIVTSHFRRDVMVILRVFTGMSLLLTAYEGNLIAPHLAEYGGFGIFLIFFQGFIGLLFIADRFMFHASGMLILLMLGVMIQYDFISVLEYCNYIGIALFFLLNHLPSADVSDKFQPYSVAMLRIFTGVALATLGVTEKITGAVLAQAFMAEHHWNFMLMLGVDWFSDRLFILSSGVMEVIFGIILVLGTTTRINTIVLSSFMLASNTVFLLVHDNPSALMELVGHMPIIGSALVLILLGYGEHLRITDVLFKGSRSTKSVTSSKPSKPIPAN